LFLYIPRVISALCSQGHFCHFLSLHTCPLTILYVIQPVKLLCNFKSNHRYNPQIRKKLWTITFPLKRKYQLANAFPIFVRFEKPGQRNRPLRSPFEYKLFKSILKSPYQYKLVQ
jgi:hypothetical protein